MLRQGTGTRKGRRNGEAGRHSGEPSTIYIREGSRFSLNAPSPSQPLVAIVGIRSTHIHPREFLFISAYRFVSRPVPALADDTAKPFAGDLQEGRARQTAGHRTARMSPSD